MTGDVERRQLKRSRPLPAEVSRSGMKLVEEEESKVSLEKTNLRSRAVEQDQPCQARPPSPEDRSAGDRLSR